jgi:broad specificity phosphatase PhoE
MNNSIANNSDNHFRDSLTEIDSNNVIDNNINSLIVTHNARLRCLITKLFNNSGEYQNEILRQQIKNFRWQNCCVLKLVVKPNIHPISQIQNDKKKIAFMLSLIYDGEIDPTENKPTYQYWGNNPTENNTITQKPKGCIGKFCKTQNNIEEEKLRYNTFNILTGNLNISDLKDTKIIGDITNINKVFTFYLVRHGQAEHNLYTKTTIKRKTDTSLTEFGNKGRKKAGIAINSDLKNNGKIEYYFASDLIRTRETFSGILNGITLGHLSLKQTNNIDIIILPCSHELAFTPDGQCDIAANMAQLFTSENNMSCTKFNNYNENTNEYKKCVMFNSETFDNTKIVIKINWSYYINFYDNSYRGNTSKKIYGSKKQCRDTSMIEQAISIITGPSSSKNENVNVYKTMENEERILGGKHRKTKKRRKHRKTKKRRKIL